MNNRIMFSGVISIVAILLLVPSAMIAQRQYGAVTYQMSIPMGDTKNYTSETSFRGFGLDFRVEVSQGMTAGLALGWNVFYERKQGTVDFEGEQVGGAISGVEDRYLNIFPMMLGIQKHLGDGKGPKPYIGLNAGGLLVRQSFATGIFSVEDDRWDWAVAPEVGLIIPLENHSMFIVNGRYNYAFTGENLNGDDINHQYWGVNVGFGWDR